MRGLAPTAEQLTELKVAPPVLDLSESDREEIGRIDEHAGFEETSRMLFLRDLVDSAYRLLEPQTTNDMDEFFEVARAVSWRGYLSSPRLALAGAGHGARLQQYRAQRTTLWHLPSWTAFWMREMSRVIPKS